MTENIFNSEELSENDTLYTDMVLEIMSSWVTGNMNLIQYLLRLVITIRL
jgi:hypothetical protein